MPFTFAHPAITLPIIRLFGKRVSITALVIGSLTPDFEYFIRFQIKSVYSHTPLGIFLFCLPVGLALTFIFHNILKKELIRNLPYFVQKRMGHLYDLDWNTYFKENRMTVIISLLIGAFTHLFWDSFTHHDGYFVTKIEVLYTIISYQNHDYYLYNILQHLSTLVGGVIILIVLITLPNTSKTKKEATPNYWVATLFSTSSILFIRFQFGLEIEQYGNVIVSTISSFIIAIIIVSLFFKSIQIHNE